MRKGINYTQSFEILGGNFIDAGVVSIQIKRLLKEIGLKPEIVYRTAICTYEAEMNVIMYAKKAKVNFSLSNENIIVEFDDEGQGIGNIDLALQEGFSTSTTAMRELGFGAGMGLPNIKKNSDEFIINSIVNKGTKLFIKININ